jgi:hypothetical protein
MVISLRNLYGAKSKMALQDQKTAKEWIEQFDNKAEEGRAELITLAKQSSLSNGELERIVKSDARGPLQGLATSILHERKRNGGYNERLSFDAPFAGALITVEEDYWGAHTTFDHPMVLSGAHIKGDFALSYSKFLKEGALMESVLEGRNIGYRSQFNSLSALLGSRIIGKGAFEESVLEGDSVLACAYIDGEEAFSGAVIKGAGAGSGAVVNGDNALYYSNWEGDHTLAGANINQRAILFVKGVYAMKGANIASLGGDTKVQGEMALVGATYEGLPLDNTASEQLANFQMSGEERLPWVVIKGSRTNAPLDYVSHINGLHTAYHSEPAHKKFNNVYKWVSIAR